MNNLKVVTQGSVSSLGHEQSQVEFNLAAQTINEGKAENTKRVHDQCARYWQAYLEANHVDVNAPIGTDLVLRFIRHHLVAMCPQVDAYLMSQTTTATNGRVYSLKSKPGTIAYSTVESRVFWLSGQYERLNVGFNPCREKAVKELLSTLKKKHTHKKKRAATKQIVDYMIDECDTETLAGLRDRALLSVAFASGGRRRSEVVALNTDDIEYTEQGYRVTVRRSKTDQAGKGAVYPLLGIYARYYREWIEAAQISGAVFRKINKAGTIEGRLSAQSVRLIVQQYIAKAKTNATPENRELFENMKPSDFGAHSLRSGFVTEAGKRGAPMGDVMQMSGHKSLSVALGYYQAGAIENNKAALMLAE